MSKFTMDVTAMVTICESETFVVEADSVEKAEEKAKELFKLRMRKKHGYADYDEEEITHYCNDWEAQ